MEPKARYLYSAIASTIEARKRCEQTGNTEWFDRWTATLRYFEENYLPSGSGIDNGAAIDLDASHAGKIVIHTAFHHMDDAGYYDEWTDHTITVTPSFDGINLRISERDRNQVKDSLHEIFEIALCQMVNPYPKLD
jgi:hypothetical protein